MKTIRLAVLGALGKLGRNVVAAANDDVQFAVTAALIRSAEGAEAFEGIPFFQKLSEIRSGIDVVVEVSQAESVGEHLAWAVEKKLPYLLAATGLSKAMETRVEKASEKIPIVVAPNLSVGVALLQEAVYQMTKSFPSDIQIVETHHKAKKDSPSGTALTIAQTVGEANPNGEVSVHSIRGGDVVGEHRVQFLAPGEKIEIAHTATDRKIFARGALTAAKFLVGRKPGIYTMREVLQLKERQK